MEIKFDDLVFREASALTSAAFDLERVLHLHPDFAKSRIASVEARLKSLKEAMAKSVLKQRQVVLDVLGLTDDQLSQLSTDKKII